MPSRTLFPVGVLSASLAAPLLFAALSPPPSERELTEQQVQLNVESFDLVWATVRDRHWDPELGGVDWVAAREELRPRVEVAPTTKEAREIITEMLDRLGHSHCSVQAMPSWARRSERGFMDREGREIWDTGCGFSVKIVDGSAVVEKVRLRSPVHDAGLRRGWKLVRIDDEDVGPCEHTTEITSRTLSARGDSLSLHFIDRHGNRREFVVPLDHCRFRNFRRGVGRTYEVWIEHGLAEDDVGYISFNAFYDPMLLISQFNSAMDSFLDAEVIGIVIDIRGNPGGWLRVATTMAAWFFVEEGAFLNSTEYREVMTRALIHPRPRTYSGPLAILVDSETASTAEIFAGGMQEQGRAHVFGVRTAGKVLGSNCLTLPNQDVLQYPVSISYTPTGRILEGTGLLPDVAVEPERGDAFDQDAAVQSAIRWFREEEQR